MSIETIYLDMDGVLADFVTPSLKAAGIPLTHDEVTIWNYFEPYMTAEEFWSKIDAVPNFWLDIEVYPWAHDLFDVCRRIAPVVFCSSPCADPKCAAQKIQWLRNHGFMGADENNYIFTNDKSQLSQKGRVLIDDSNKNCREFQRPKTGVQFPMAGQSIEFPQKWNDAAGETTNRVEYVSKWLKFLSSPPSKALADAVTNTLTKEFKDSNPKDSVGCTKPPLHCIPMPVLFEVGMGMYEGGWKYREANWRVIGVRASIYFDAAMRHLTAWWDGEDIDPASKIHHISKVMSCLAVLRDCQMQAENGSGVSYKDDRPPKSVVPMAKLETQFKAMLERLQTEHGDRKEPYTEIGLK